MQTAANHQSAQESSRVGHECGIELQALRTVVFFPPCLSVEAREMLFSLARGFGHVVRDGLAPSTRRLSFADFAQRIARVYDTQNPGVAEALDFLASLHELDPNTETHSC